MEGARDFVFLLGYAASLLLADERQTVAHGDNDLLDPGVLLDAVVEGENAAGLGLALGFGIHDFAGP